jgi:ACS family glucarate transporter-like MFS transporter
LIVIYFGWKSSFFLLSILGVIGSVIWWKYARDWPNEHPDVNAEELKLTANNNLGDNQITWSLIKNVLTNTNVLLLSLSYLCMNYVFYIFFSWLFIYLVNERNFSILEGGFLASLPFLMGAIGATVGGYMCDRLQKKVGPTWGHRIPVILGLIPSGACLIFGSITQNPYLAVVSLALCFGFIQLTEGPYWSTIAFVSRENAQAGGGVLNTGGNLGGVIATPLIPILVAQFDWVIALSSGAVFAVMGLVFFMFINFKENIKNGEMSK